jgi:TrkA domain protein
MQVSHSTVPGTGTIHHFLARGGKRFAVVVGPGTRRGLLVYDSGDEPAYSVELEADEADQVADTLHSRPLADRVAALERQVAALGGAA